VELASTDAEEWTVDELAQHAAVPVRTIREYQTMGLLHPPRKVGRVGLYGTAHLRRLQLIARLQDRGYSLAGIGDLLAAWRAGDAIGDVLGLGPDQLVHVDEPGTPATLGQLAELLPSLIPDRLDDLLATGVIEDCGPERFCVPSPSLLQLAVDALAAGLDPETVLELLAAFGTAADSVTKAVLDALSQLPSTRNDAAVEVLIGRGRGLLAHGIGRLTLHRIGGSVGVTDEDTPAQITQRLTARGRSRSATQREPSP